MLMLFFVARDFILNLAQHLLPGGYVATFQDVGLSGDDGLIVDEGRCQIFMASAGLVVNLAQNLQLLEIWGDPPTPSSKGPRFKWFDLGLGPNHGRWETPMYVKQAGVFFLQLLAFDGFGMFIFLRYWLDMTEGF